MLYIEEKYFQRQIALLEYFNSKGGFDVIVWLYPESRIWHLFDFKLVEGTAEEGLPVTRYNDSNMTRKRTMRMPLNETFIRKVKNNRRIYSTNCDSCVLYKQGENKCHGAAIGHEGMFILFDDEELLNLKRSGFSASKEKPDWW
jgi:hypothetical protein